MSDIGDSGSGQRTLTYQRLCDKVTKLDVDNLYLKEQIISLNGTISELRTTTTSNLPLIQRFSDTFTSETTNLQANIHSIIEQLEGIDTIKEQQFVIAAKHSSLVSETEQKVKSWASLCNNIAYYASS